jgi:hypothetical protein
MTGFDPLKAFDIPWGFIVITTQWLLWGTLEVTHIWM